MVAAATPTGRSALAVVRVTGSGLDAVIAPVVRPLRPGPWAPGRVRRVGLWDGPVLLDDGVAVLRPAARSPTGEDLLELTVHGNPLVVQRLVDALIDAGARPAPPGEFTRRAVLAGRLDLVQAEAVDQLIRATSAEGLRVARDGLGGRLGRVVAEARERLVGAAAELEARLDFPDDELALVSDEQVVLDLHDVASRCRGLAATLRAGRARVDGLRIALVGPVNAGKSSLLNALVGRTRALVDARPGTTRDVVEARARVGPLEVTLLDTAGERPTDDPIEAAGLALAKELIDEVDLLLVVLRAGPGGPDPIEVGLLARTADRPRVVVWNGIDRADAGTPPAGAVGTSALTGSGLDALRDAVVAAAGAVPSDALVLASPRQRDLLLAVADGCDRAIAALPDAGVAAAADAVVQAIEEIDTLTGADTRESVLDAVFARFCIGK